MAKSRTATPKTKRNAGQPAGEIGASISPIADFLGCSVTQLEDVVSVINSFEYRVSQWQTFGINRSELWALLALHGHLKILKKPLVSQDGFINYLSGTFNQRTKFYGYIEGLKRLKCIGSFEYTRNPGSLSIGITDFGFVIIRDYYKQLNALFGRYMIDEVDNVRSISVAENIPTYYTARQSA